MMVFSGVPFRACSLAHFSSKTLMVYSLIELFVFKFSFYSVTYWIFSLSSWQSDYSCFKISVDFYWKTFSSWGWGNFLSKVNIFCSCKRLYPCYCLSSVAFCVILEFVKADPFTSYSFIIFSSSSHRFCTLFKACMCSLLS